MSHEKYLKRWAEEFGEDAEEGVTRYYEDGKPRLVKVHRLSPEQFDQHVQGLKDAYGKLKAAVDADDEEGVHAALDEAFPHEIALLL